MIVALTQGSQEWLDFKKFHLGASEMPAVMGASPYGTAKDLFLEKTGKRKPKASSAAMTRGSELEASARAWFELRLGREFGPAVLEDDQMPFMSASLDGLSADNEVLEIKSPGRESFLEIRKNGIPRHHMIQVQCQLLIAKAQCAFYLLWDGSRGYSTRVEPCQKLFEEIRYAAGVFWQKVEDKTWTD